MTTSWHGVTLDDRTAAMMDEVQRLVSLSSSPWTIVASQGSYSTAVSASAGTHSGGGAIDLSLSGLTTGQVDLLVATMRQVGFAAWHRTVAEGFTPHVHGIAVGCPDLGPAAADQVTAYNQGRNGLATNAPDDGPREYVGQTWEGYLAGTPAAGSTRVFRGDQLDFANCDVAPGSSFTVTDLVNAMHARNDGASVTMHPGDVIYLWPNTTHATLADVVSLITWRLNASGPGTLALSEGFDTGTTYITPTTYTPLAATPVPATLGLTATPALPTTTVHRMLVDGTPVLRVECTSGTIVLDWFCLQVEPPAGLLTIASGHWSPWHTPGLVDQTPDYVRYVGLSGGGDVSYTDGNAGQPADINDRIDTALAAARTLTEGSWLDASSGGFSVGNRVLGRSFWHQPNGLVASYDHTIIASAGSGVVTGRWQTWPTLRQIPDFLAHLVRGVDYDRAPGSTAPEGTPEAYGEFAAGDTVSVAWSPLTVTLAIQNYHPDLMLPRISLAIDGAASSPGSVRLGGSSLVDFGDNPAAYVDLGAGTSEADPAPVVVVPTAGADFSMSLVSTFDTATHLPPPAVGWNGADGDGIEHGYGASAGSTSVVRIRVRMPGYRYWVPNWVRSPDALDLTDPEGVTTVVTYLRNKQRNDGLGAWSAARSRGVSSQQRSLRNRGYR